MASPFEIIRKAASGGAAIRPMGALASAITRLQGNLYSAPNETIPGMSTTDWPSPLQPVRPFGGPDAQPLGMNMIMGQNLIFTPRPDARYTAVDLQALATYPLARICISNVQDTIGALRWKIQLRDVPGEDRKAKETREAKDSNIGRLTEFLEMPNSDQDLSEFTRQILNDMLTIDAGCVLLRKDKADNVFEWRAMQGAYITCLVDKNGYRPLPPAPAYQQLWEGIPRVNLSTDQLVYRPRNLVYIVGNTASSLYGLSPTEQVAEELEVGINRLRYVKAFYKDGSIPNVLWVVPPDTAPDKVSDAMRLLNQDMAGNLEARRQFRFAQGFKGSESGKDDQIKQFDEPKLSDEYDDLHTRRICFAYGTSAQRLLRMMTRATAQSNQEAAEEEGIAPFRKWTENFYNYIIQAKMKMSKYEFRYDLSVDADPGKQAEIDKNDLDNSKLTINEVRIRSGLDPHPEPQCDQIGKWIATGWVPITQTPPLPLDPNAAKPTAKPKPAAADDDDKEKVRKAAEATANTDRGSVRVRTARTQLFARVWQFFHGVVNSMVIVSPHTKKMRKDDPGDEELEAEIEAIVTKIMDSIPWKSVPDYVEPAIEEAVLSGAHEGLEQAERAFQDGPQTISLAPQPVRIITQSIISDVNQVAMDYAKKRSAELVGMKWVDGELVENPNAAMAITDSTRDMLRRILTEAFSQETPMNELVSRIRAAGVFSEERAQLIADTEVKMAQSRGNLEAWQKTGVIKSIKWLTSSLHVDQDECDENRDAGPVELGKNFPSGDPAPPAHPKCLCVAAIAELNPPKKSTGV